jgi:hypothetical protein
MELLSNTYDSVVKIAQVINSIDTITVALVEVVKLVRGRSSSNTVLICIDYRLDTTSNIHCY